MRADSFRRLIGAIVLPAFACVVVAGAAHLSGTPAYIDVLQFNVLAIAPAFRDVGGAPSAESVR